MIRRDQAPVSACRSCSGLPMPANGSGSVCSITDDALDIVPIGCESVGVVGPAVCGEDDTRRVSDRAGVSRALRCAWARLSSRRRALAGERSRCAVSSSAS